MEKNYFNVIMNESFDLLTSKKVSWPYELDNQQRTVLVERCLEYFTEKEEYAKCAELKKKIQSLIKRNKTTRRSYGKQKNKGKE